jgi:hypothetical protein
MTYIPQEAKEQIAALMADVERLEQQKEDTYKALDKTRKQNQANSEKSSMIIYSLAAAIVVLLIGIVFVYLYGPVVETNRKEKASYDLYVKSIEQQNMKYKSDISKLKAKLASGGYIDGKNPDLLYKVQIGAFKSFSLESYYKEQEALLEKDEYGFKKYSLGSFTRYQDALKFKKEIKRLGFREAFLVAEYKGKSIDIKEAIKLEKVK